MSKFNGVVNELSKFITKHSPEILVGLGITGMITSTVVAIKETPLAAKKIEDRKEELKVEKLPVKEVIKQTWKQYLPVLGLTAVSTGCIVGASSKYLKRNAALATAYNLSDTAFRVYRSKVLDTIGEKKEHEIRDKVNAEALKQNPISSAQIIITDNGKQLFFDTLSGRYFLSDVNTIKKVVNDLNREMRDSGYISLNDFYSELGLEETKLGDELGWNIDKANIDIYFSSKVTEEDKACMVIDFCNLPFFGFDSRY